MKLAAKLVLVVLFAVMLLTGMFGYLSVQHGIEQFQQAHEQQARELASEMHAELLAAWRNEGQAGVARIVKWKESVTELVQIRWVPLDGRDDRPSRPNDPRGTPSTLVTRRMETVVVQTPTGESFLQTYHPLELDQHAGRLEVSRSMAPVDQMSRLTVRRMLIQLGLMAAICCLVIVLAGVRLIGRPLDALIQQTQRIARGDFTHPVPVSSNDELGKLATALSRMGDKLQQQQATIALETASRIATLEQLRHADRLKTVGRLAAGIAHELGTPLNVVAGRAALIASDRLSREEVKQSAEAIKSEADRITSVIRQLLDFARRNSPHRTSADLHQVIRQTVRLLDSLATKQGVRLQLRDCDEVLTAKVDVGQIQQVLTNVIVNAIHAMPEGGDVTIVPSRDTSAPPNGVEAGPGEYYRIDVQDQGQGIDAEDLPHIFEPFFTTKDVGQGTGLGLSIAYSIVQEHGGWIDVSSQLGKGSRLSIFIPKDAEACTAES